VTSGEIGIISVKLPTEVETKAEVAEPAELDAADDEAATVVPDVRAADADVADVAAGDVENEVVELIAVDDTTAVEVVGELLGVVTPDDIEPDDEVGGPENIVGPLMHRVSRVKS
jgi:hypothetical protein